MPRVKIDYVVSFTSEDPENPAANLLSCEAGRGRWLCARGEPAASVVLQLARACTISSLTIGAYQAALVEILVGRSETPSEPFQVLVPSSVFLGPRESRAAAGGAAAERVRTFARAALAAGARDQRWDRVRVVATQPYNKQCKFGISFVHMYEPEQTGAPPPLPLPPEEEEEEAFRPGELFAQHRRAAAATTTTTGAQIRQATSQALRSEPEANTALRKTDIPRGRRSGAGAAAGDRDQLLYAAEERTLHHAHATTPQRNQNTPADKHRGEPSTTKTLHDNTETEKRERDHTGTTTPRYTHGKRTHSTTQDARPLEGVVFVLSGYENPQRARVRDLAVSLGARPQREWGPACTHLICAFPNTPKMRGVLASGGARVPVVRADWLEACARARRRLPWRAHATDPTLRDQPSSPPDPSECDTDDEIEQVVRLQKRAAASSARAEDDVQSDTEPEGEDGAARGGGDGGELPALLAGLAFLVAEHSAAPLDASLLARYARAYGGHLLAVEEAESRAGLYYVLCGTRGAGGGGTRGAGTRLRADWLWACHQARQLLPTDDYLL